MTTIYFKLLVVCFLLLGCSMTTLAAPYGKIESPPISERWYGIYVNNERVGFYRLRIDKQENGYRMEGSGSVRMKVMSFTKEASMHETYLVSKNLAIRSFDVEQTINGAASHLSGSVSGGTIRMKNEAHGTTTNNVLKLKGEVYPGPALNVYPLMRGVTPASTYKIQLFDPEELKIKEVQITVLGMDKTSDGLPALKLRNNLYPFVNNDVWVDELGNTLEESVREGLVTTKVEQTKDLSTYISDWALAKKDLIYDFSLVRIQPPITEPKKLTGLMVEITDWNDSMPLFQEDWQQVEQRSAGRITVKTGAFAQRKPDEKPQRPTEAQLKPATKIESDAPVIIAQATLLAAGTTTRKELATALTAWTADWLHNTIDDGGGALESFTSRNGNCQTHARLYTALARAAGIPTRFVSGLVHLEGKGFLYHSWAESFIGDTWVSVDPTYNQLPADPTHIKLLEGHLPENMAPIIAIIGRIKMTVLQTKY